MSILASAAVLSLLFLAGLTPWWIAGRHLVPASERVALSELGVDGVIATLRRGAGMYVPATLRD